MIGSAFHAALRRNAKVVPSSVEFTIDLFTDANNTGLASHTPTGGLGTWVAVTDAALTNAAEIQSNALSLSPAAQHYEGWHINPGLGANCRASVVVTQAGAGLNNYFAIGIRITTSVMATLDGYVFEWNSDTGPELSLYAVTNGVFGILDSANLDVWTDGQTIEVEAIGSTIKGYVNGVEMISVVDETFSAAGGVALFYGKDDAASEIILDTLIGRTY